MSRANGPILRRWLLGCGGVVLLMFVGLGLGGWYLYHLWRSVPEGWQRVESMRELTTPEQRSALAAEVEKRVLAALSFPAGPRGSRHPQAAPAMTDPAMASRSDRPGIHVLTLTNDEINAWLEHRLPMWAANRGTPLPTQVDGIRYWPEGGHPSLAARVTLDGATQVVSMTFDLIMSGGETARLELGELRGGQLPMPGDQLIEEGIAELRKASDSSELAETVAQVLSGGAFEPVVPIDHERQVRLTDFGVDESGMTLTFHSEPISSR